MYEIDKKKVYKLNKFCGNCGKSGHVYKNCNDPITSYGIITIKINNILETDLLSLNTMFSSKNINIANISGINYTKNINKFKYYSDKIKFLLIRRKHTLGYTEFVRGHYKTDNIDGIIYLFKQMINEQ